MSSRALHHSCHILPPSEIDRWLFFGCFHKLRREETISQNRPKGQNMATMYIISYHSILHYNILCHIIRLHDVMS